MTKQTLWLAGLLLTLLTASGAPAQAPSDVLPDMEAGGMPPADVTPEPAAVEGIAPEHIHVLLLGGVNKDPEEKQNKDRAVIRMPPLLHRPPSACLHPTYRYLQIALPLSRLPMTTPLARPLAKHSAHSPNAWAQRIGLSSSTQGRPTLQEASCASTCQGLT